MGKVLGKALRLYSRLTSLSRRRSNSSRGEPGLMVKEVLEWNRIDHDLNLMSTPTNQIANPMDPGSW